METFKKVIDKFHNVEVSEFGRVRYIDSGKFLKPYLNRNRYVVFVQEDQEQFTRTISQLVAKHFIDNPKNFKYVCQLDGDILNCNKSNLKWVGCVREVKAKANEYQRKTESKPIDELFMAEMAILDKQYLDKLNPFKTKKSYEKTI